MYDEKLSGVCLPVLALDYKPPVYIWIAPLESCAYKSLGILFKSLIANMDGFFLWLSLTSIMIKVFKVALAQWLSYYQWI